MRGTLHFVAGDDLGWMLGLTGARMLQTAAGPRRQLGLTDDRLRARRGHRSRAPDRRAARRPAPSCSAAFDADGVSTAGQRGVHILGQLAQLGILVLAARDSWALLDEWVPVAAAARARRGAAGVRAPLLLGARPRDREGLRVVVVADAHRRARRPRGRPRPARRARGRRRRPTTCARASSRPGAPCTCSRASTSTCSATPIAPRRCAGMHFDRDRARRQRGVPADDRRRRRGRRHLEAGARRRSASW